MGCIVLFRTFHTALEQEQEQDCHLLSPIILVLIPVPVLVPDTASMITPVQGPPSCPSPLLVKSGGQDLRPVQTCSLKDPSPGADIWWLLKHVWSVSRWYTVYWNTFSFILHRRIRRLQGAHAVPSISTFMVSCPSQLLSSRRKKGN